MCFPCFSLSLSLARPVSVSGLVFLHLSTSIPVCKHATNVGFVSLLVLKSRAWPGTTKTCIQTLSTHTSCLFLCIFTNISRLVLTVTRDNINNDDKNCLHRCLLSVSHSFCTLLLDCPFLSCVPLRPLSHLLLALETDSFPLLPPSLRPCPIRFFFVSVKLVSVPVKTHAWMYVCRSVCLCIRRF